MKEQLRDKYFLAVRMGMLILLELYIVISQAVLTGASAKVLLLLALFIGTMTAAEWGQGTVRKLFLAASAVLFVVIYRSVGEEFLLLGIFLGYELLYRIKPGPGWYFVPVLAALVPGPVGIPVQIMVSLLIAVIYMQHDFIIESYIKQTKADMVQEQHLKQNIYRQENEVQEEIKRGLLMAENHILEERETLSQTLHDKLGHNINGSVYQLEAVKVLMDRDPETSRTMIQAVIDQLRTGMDEIRAILRKGRPPKYKMAVLQLQKLCEECRVKGIDASLVIEGELAQIPPKLLEIMLDNAYEAVSNSMKYAKCTKIEMKIIVMNQLVRCAISDNGIGCSEITDGMGLAGMRRRIREVNGVIDFVSEAGFTINMLMPI